MCKKETYKRFDRLYNTHKQYNNFSRIYNTKMGEREVVVKKFIHDGTIYIVYKDFDGSTLFHIEISKKGNIHIYKTKIDSIAIFSAIYEIETILYKEKEERDKILEQLFEHNTNMFNIGYMGFKF